MITVEKLQARREELKNEIVRLTASINAMQGAIQILDEIIASETTPSGAADDRN